MKKTPKLSPLRDKKIESLAKIQKINLDMSNLEDEEKRVKKLSSKLQAFKYYRSDLEEKKVYLWTHLLMKKFWKKRVSS